MAIINVSAGVYPQEMDFSDYVASVATFDVGMVTVAERGLEGREGARVPITSWDEYKARVGVYRADSYGAYTAKAYFDNGGGSLYISRLFNVNASTGAYTTAARATKTIMNTAATPANLLKLEAYDFGVWGNKLTVDIAANVVVHPDGFNLTVKYDGTVVEAYTHLTFNTNDPDYVAAQLEDSRYLRATVVGTGTIATGTGLTFTAGNDGVTNPTDDDYVAAIKNFSEVPIALLLLPGVTSATVISSALEFAETRGDLMVLVDTAENASVDTAISYRNGFNSSYGAMYYPWVVVRDDETGVRKTVPPSGSVAAVYATSPIWEAPAGVERGVLENVVEAKFDLPLEDREKLYGAGINPIASFMDAGTVVWGQKTLQSRSTSLDRVNVRNMLNFIKRTVAVYAQSLVFEGNDATLWRKFTRSVTPLLQRLKDRGGIRAYQVKCDASLNTVDVIDRHEMIARIYIQPVKTAEFIGVQFVVTPTGVRFSQIRMAA